MRIENQKLLADITTIIGNAGYYLNENTGEIRKGQSFSFLMSTLRDFEFGWKNISDIGKGDLEDSGFDILHAGHYYNSPKSPWVSIAPDYQTGTITKGRRVAKTSWIICSKDVVDPEELEAVWVKQTNERNDRSKAYSEIYNKTLNEAIASGMSRVEAMNHASKVAHAEMA